MAFRISGVGWVTVSLRRSMNLSMEILSFELFIAWRIEKG
jgi:hypothetical protein